MCVPRTDRFVHLSGGGGGAGPEPVYLRQLLVSLTRYGVTSCGVLGTDGAARTMRDLIAQTMALRRIGILVLLHGKLPAACPLDGMTAMTSSSWTRSLSRGVSDQ